MYANDRIGQIASTSRATSTGMARAEHPQQSSWYSQLANAWGAALDRQADKTAALAQRLTDGYDEPAAALQVSAAAHQLAFISTAASTASNSIGQALETLGRKQ